MRKKLFFSFKKLKNTFQIVLGILEVIGKPILITIKFCFSLLKEFWQELSFLADKLFFFLAEEYTQIIKSLNQLDKQLKNDFSFFISLFINLQKITRQQISFLLQIIEILWTKSLTSLAQKVKEITFLLKKFKLPKFYYPKFNYPTLRFPKIKFPKLRFLSFKNLSILVSARIDQFFASLKFPSIKIPKIRFNLRFPKFSFPRKIYLFLFFLFSLCCLLFAVLIFTFFRTLPSPELLKTRNIILTTKIYDRNNNLLYKIYKNQNRTLVALSDLPKYLIDATVAIEDRDFYHHRGFSIRGILRAVRQNYFLRQRLEGGSTITQQLVKNALLTPERTLLRKIKEIILALEIESKFSKEEILTMYFNEVGYGGAAYGIFEASQMYFAKVPKELTLAESTLLAGLPGAPTYYSPFGADPKRATARQHEVLRRMVEDGYITENAKRKTQSAKLEFAPQIIDISAPHFVMYVKDLLVQKYGEKMVEQGGLTVKTSLDLKVQEMAENEVKTGVESQNYLFVGNGAAIVTQLKTGEVLAMVGSKNYWDMENDGNVNVCLMERQPGSSIKPVNYAVALQKGLTTTTIIPDSPVAFNTSGQPPYVPQNYDGRFRGNVTLRQALGNSLNIPAVKVLASYGVDEMIDMGEKLGITTWGDRSRFGLALTLGGGEVKMVDMAVAFGTFANSGVRVDLNPILEVKDSRGRTLENLELRIKSARGGSARLAAKRAFGGNSELGEKVLPEGVAFLISNILADNYARSAVFGPNSPLVIPNHTVSVKTGTTDTKRDNWTIGYTSSYLTAVWIGNNNNQPMSMYLESGYTGAAPIWHKIMANLLKEKNNEPLVKPETVLEVPICSYNGLLPCDGCPTRTEYFLYGTEPKIHCRSEDLKPKATPTP